MAAFSSSAFSTSAFSVAAFDFGEAPPPAEDYIGKGQIFSYPLPKKREIYDQVLDEIEAQQRELEKVEEQRVLAEDNTKELAYLDNLMIQIQAEINRLSQERVLLMRLIDDEEAIFVLMSSRPFH